MIIVAVAITSVSATPSSSDVTGSITFIFRTNRYRPVAVWSSIVSIGGLCLTYVIRRLSGAARRELPVALDMRERRR